MADTVVLNDIEFTFLRVSELAQLLNVKKGTVYRWVCEDKIPYHKLGQMVRFDQDVILAWLSETRRGLEVGNVKRKRQIKKPAAPVGRI